MFKESDTHGLTLIKKRHAFLQRLTYFFYSNLCLIYLARPDSVINTWNIHCLIETREFKIFFILSFIGILYVKLQNSSSQVRYVTPSSPRLLATKYEELWLFYCEQ